MEAAARAKAGGKKKAGAKTGKKKGQAASRPYAREMGLYQGYTSMCSGYFKLSVALKKEQKVLLPAKPFDNEQFRYEHRFCPLWCLVRPPMMPYE